MYVITVTERVPCEEGQKDTNTYHFFRDNLHQVAESIKDLEAMFIVPVAITIVPFKE